MLYAVETAEAPPRKPQTLLEETGELQTLNPYPSHWRSSQESQQRHALAAAAAAAAAAHTRAAATAAATKQQIPAAAAADAADDDEGREPSPQAGGDTL